MKVGSTPTQATNSPSLVATGELWFLHAVFFVLKGTGDVMGFLAFDIETGPLGDDRLLELCPPAVLPVHPGVFDPAAVKVGHLKDPGKIREKIEAARQAHQDAVDSYGEACEAARVKAFADFKDKAALEATTGRVVAIGMAEYGGIPSIIDCDGTGGWPALGLAEGDGIAAFWQMIEKYMRDQMPIVGFNIMHFDLPFLVRRSWMLGIPVPMGVRKGRYWADSFIDLMQVWGFYGRDMVKLNTVAMALGLGGKVTEADGVAVSGADFHRLWRENRAAAEVYLQQDVQLCISIAIKIGAV